MPSSTLLLSVDKGPKKGETLVCEPGKVIGIGRVVTGNTLAIRDPGISQKHLTVFFVPETTRWFVNDLGSSNGTCINGSLISPERPSSLTDGDVIKIGERTSISVNISASLVEPLVLPRRGRSSRPPKAVTIVDEGCQGNVVEPAENGLRKRTRGRYGGRSTRVLRKDAALESVVVERRVKRVSYRDCSTMVSVKEEEEEEEVEIISNSDFIHVDGKEKQIKGNNTVAEEEAVAVLGEKNPRIEEMEVDMNNMTLGEWFDRMKQYLPHAINKVAEEIIAKLREKARLFDEHISQNSNVEIG